MNNPIKHVWFDLDGTLSIHTPEFNKAHDALRYATYAKATGKPLSPDLADEYEQLYAREGSNSAVFRSLGLPSNYWMDHFNTLDKSLYYQAIPEIYETLEKLKDIVPISLFTNDSAVGTAKTLKVIKVEETWFTHILTGDLVKERKPNLEGYRLVVSKSGLPAHRILYVGDRVDVDIKPAHAVGMQTCLVYGQSDDADYSCAAFSGLLDIFDNG